MGAEPKQTNDLDRLSVPPGFASLTSFFLKKDENGQKGSCSRGTIGTPKQGPKATEVTLDNIDANAFRKSIKYRPWILYGQRNQIKEEPDKGHSSKSSLPKEVSHGCPNTSKSQKIKTELCLIDAQAYTLEEIPVFHPTEEEFADTLKYVESIRLKAEPYGICRIVPPHSWQPQCQIKENNVWGDSEFHTEIQHFDKFETQCVQRKGTEFEKNVNGFESKPGPKLTLEAFKKYADDFFRKYFIPRDTIVEGFVKSNQQNPSVEKIEDEYRRFVRSRTEETKVLHSDILDTSAFGSGFPSESNHSETSKASGYLTSGWNLNNVSRLPGSLLGFESDQTSSILVPRLQIGMLFSSLYWRVEEHHLYALYYLHFGDPRVWYVVPRKFSLNFEAAMRKYITDLLNDEPKSCQIFGPGLSPSILESEGVPVYRCIQRPGEFVLIFPGACHSGFNCGFNFVESANFAPVNWLPHGQNAVELYQERERITAISQDKLLIRATKEAVREAWEILLAKKKSSDNLRWKDASGKNGILTKALRSRVMLEGNRRKYLWNFSQSKRMDADFDATSKQECSICLCDLHLSAVSCQCSANTFSCINHAKQLCSCAWTEKIFLYRYEMDELNTLVEALEGKLSAVYKWCKGDFNSILHSVSKEECEKKESRFPDASVSISKGWSTADSIMAELKARVRQSKPSKEKNKVSLAIQMQSKEKNKVSLPQPMKSKENVILSTTISKEAQGDAFFLNDSSLNSESSDSDDDSSDFDFNIGEAIGIFSRNPISCPPPRCQKEALLSEIVQAGTMPAKAKRSIPKTLKRKASS